MGSPLGLVLAGMFLEELETSVILILGRLLLKCKRYVDGTICYVKIGTVDDNLNKLNGFHQIKQFSNELEKNNKLAFFNVLFIRNKDASETTKKIFRKVAESSLIKEKRSTLNT